MRSFAASLEARSNGRAACLGSLELSGAFEESVDFSAETLLPSNSFVRCPLVSSLTSGYYIVKDGHVDAGL